MKQIYEQLLELQSKIDEAISKLGLDQDRLKLAELEKDMSDPNSGQENLTE